tara:strand:+ start:729 stop:860 length:132 start_codon:yes stop_codon:yes gene_type:complete
MKEIEVVRLLELFEIFNFNIKQIEEDMKILKNILRKKQRENNY